MTVKDNHKIFFWASLFGSVNFLGPVITLFYLHRGLQYSDLLVMLTCIVVSMFIFEVPTGAFADKYGPKASFIIGQVLSIINGIILIFAFNRWTFYAISVLTGLAITFFSGSDESFIYESLKESKKEKDMSKVWGKIVSTSQIAGIFTILIGAVIAKDLLEALY
jgi:MFS family permease